MTNQDQTIRELAYYKWEAAGRPCGQDLAFWVEAQDELTVQVPKKKKKTAKAVQQSTDKKKIVRRSAI